MSLIIFDSAIATLLGQKRTYLNTCWLGLYTDNWIPAKADTFVGHTEASYHGYLRQAVNFGAATYNSTLGQAQMLTGTYVFQGDTGAGLPVNIYGYAVFDAAAAGNLIFAERYSAAPFSLADTTKAFLVQLNMQDTYQ